MAAIGSAWVRPGGNESTDSLVLCDCRASLQVVRGEALERLRTNEFQPSPLPKLLGFMGTGTRRSRTQRPAVLFPPDPQGDVGGGIASSDIILSTSTEHRIKGVLRQTEVLTDKPPNHKCRSPSYHRTG